METFTAAMTKMTAKRSQLMMWSWKTRYSKKRVQQAHPQFQPRWWTGGDARESVRRRIYQGKGFGQGATGSWFFLQFENLIGRAIKNAGKNESEFK
jgi:hypothetical protein